MPRPEADNVARIRQVACVYPSGRAEILQARESTEGCECYYDVLHVLDKLQALLTLGHDKESMEHVAARLYLAISASKGTVTIYLRRRVTSFNDLLR